MPHLIAVSVAAASVAAVAFVVNALWPIDDLRPVPVRVDGRRQD